MTLISTTRDSQFCSFVITFKSRILFSIMTLVGGCSRRIKYIEYFKLHQPLTCEETVPWSSNILFVFLHQPQVDSWIFVPVAHNWTNVHEHRRTRLLVWTPCTSMEGFHTNFPVSKFSTAYQGISDNNPLVFAYISSQQNKSGKKTLFVTSQRVQLVSQVSRNVASLMQTWGPKRALL